MTTEINNLASIIEEIKASQQKVLKAFEKHNSLVIKSLEVIQQLKTETKVEIVKVKDPLEEIKYVSQSVDRYIISNNFDMSARCGFLTNIFNILFSYNKDKISTSFKEIFLNILKECLNIDKPDSYSINKFFIHIKDFKEKILQVRDIRWLLLELEKYPQYFQFTEDDLTVMKDNNASRDNIYLIKKFLKKDGEYEEFYSEEEGGGIKLKYCMKNGSLHGEYKEFYPNGKIKQETSYTNGIQDNDYKVWCENGQQFVEGKINGENIQWYENGNIMNKYTRLNGKLEGEYIEWHENGNLWIKANHKDDKLCGDFELYYIDGKLNLKMFCIDGRIGKYTHMTIKKDGEYKSWYDNGTLWVHSNYKNNVLDGKYIEWDMEGKLRKECRYKDGVLDGEYKFIDSNLKKIHQFNCTDNVFELKEENFYLNNDKMMTNIGNILVVLFYNNECTDCERFLPEFKKISLCYTDIPYAICDIGKYPKIFEQNKLTKKPFKNVPTIDIYYKGASWIRYSKELNIDIVKDFIKQSIQKLLP
jgi:antitoxin component YwqK of YwqJK toxin-antitoxin module